MEVDSLKEVFQRSEEMHNVKYAQYIGDGDSKTFKAILDLDPYNNDLKKECIGHVEKNAWEPGSVMRRKQTSDSGEEIYFHAPEDVPFINSDPDQRKDVMLGESFNISINVIHFDSFQ
ncbi:hypothetical protein NQ318_008329 [Aromia moschata]|uniref:Mutator-like transposase domain-containing protein n=1 Tax=Aromia moschata TaxID=1265417 RepID=A0AAV8XWF1_9CUCU|nr:hypothetical protein NQ318_008329 [Aromia moschata]